MIQKSFVFIARRYLFTKDKHSTINFMIKICFLGILIATSSLALVVSIMTGFEKATYEKIQSIYPDLIINGQGEQFDMESLGIILKNPAYGIKDFTKHQTGQALIINPENSQTPIMIMLHGIDPQKESLVSKLDQKIIHQQNPSIEKLIENNQVIIGSKLAETTNLLVGSTANILYTHDQPSGLRITFQQAQVTISGIFKTGVEEFDNNSLYCNPEFFTTLFADQGAEDVHLKLLPHANPQEVTYDLKNSLKTDVYSWISLYPSLISALKLEKYAMFFILLLIVFVASMNIVSLISMYVSQKKGDIAILKCLGMHTESIRAIFITISLLITSIATTFGLLMAYAIGTTLQSFPFIKLPDNIYDTTHLPIKMELSVFLAIFLITIVLSFFASILATRNIQSMKIIETLKSQ